MKKIIMFLIFAITITFTVNAAGEVTGEIVHAGYDKPYQKIVVNVLGEEKELVL